MRSLLYTFVLLIPSLVSGTGSAKNDWNTPCHNGSCTYHAQNSTHAGASGSVSINGTTSAISDLTEAAGWTILDCQKNSTAQDIRAICTGDDSDCAHVYNNGALHTIVRLPENCGKMPFARIANEWSHDNQTVPDHVQQKLRRRSDGQTRTVRGISLDTDWRQIDLSTHGEVSVQIVAATAATPPSESRQLSERLDIGGDLSSLGHAALSEGATLVSGATSAAGAVASDIKSVATVVVTGVQSIATGVATDVKSVATVVATDIKSIATVIASAITSAAGAIATGIEGTGTGTLGTLKGLPGQISKDLSAPITVNTSGNVPFSLSKSYTLAKQVQQCSAQAVGSVGFQASIGAIINGQASGQVQYMVAVGGTLSPPALTTFALNSVLDAEILATIDLAVLGQASYSTGEMEVASAGLPGLDFPGILEIGPTFTIYAQGDATLQASLDTTVELGFKVDGTTFTFPGTSQSTIGTFTPLDSKVGISGDATVGASGSFTAHLIPAVTFGLNAFDSMAVANVKLQFDASASATMNLTKSTTTAFGGCMDVSSGLDLSVNVDADFFKLFKKSADVSLWSKSFDLWNKCFSKKRQHARALGARPFSPVKRDGDSPSVECGGLSVPGPKISEEQTVPGISLA